MIRPGDASLRLLLFQLRGTAAAVPRDDFGYRCGRVKPVRVGLETKGLDFGELFLALQVLIERLEGQRRGPFPGIRAAV